MPPTLLPPVDTARCPLCGQPNGCAMAAGCAPESCWCMAPQTAIDRAALDRVPEAARGKACICPACGAVSSAHTAAPASPPI